MYKFLRAGAPLTGTVEILLTLNVLFNGIFVPVVDHTYKSPSKSYEPIPRSSPVSVVSYASFKVLNVIVTAGVLVFVTLIV